MKTKFLFLAVIPVLLFCGGRPESGPIRMTVNKFESNPSSGRLTLNLINLNKPQQELQKGKSGKAPKIYKTLDIKRFCIQKRNELRCDDAFQIHEGELKEKEPYSILLPPGEYEGILSSETPRLQMVFDSKFETLRSKDTIRKNGACVFENGVFYCGKIRIRSGKETVFRLKFSSELHMIQIVGALATRHGHGPYFSQYLDPEWEFSEGMISQESK